MPITPEKRKVWKLSYVCAAIGSLIWLISMGLWYEYNLTRSRVPLPESGRIYSFNTHGSIVYLTKEEELQLYGLMTIAAAFVIGALVIEFRPKRRREG